MKRLILGLALLPLTASLQAQAPQSSDDKSTEARLLGSPDIARPADYPPGAVRQKQQGRVWLELTIDERGRVSECDVQKSSGHALLDRTTCALYRRRARYSPARDAAGKAITAKDQRSVDWRIAASGPEAVDYDSPNIPQGTSIIRSTDYPAAALKQEEQGTVAALLRVDEAGKAQSCTIEQSSGSSTLDTRTCEVLMTRGRFEPSRDERGRATAGELRQRVTWRMEDGPRQLRNSATEAHLRFGEDGKLISCRYYVRSAGVLGEPFDCPGNTDRKAPPRLLELVSGGRATAVSEQRIIVEEATAEPLPPLQRNERLWNELRLQMSLDTKGKVTSCEVLQGPKGADPCRFAPREMAPVLVDGKPSGKTIQIVHRNLVRFENAADAGPKLLNPEALITEADYPVAAARTDAQGSVLMQLAVDADGRVSGCTIIASSGSAVLDNEACRLTRERARFEPAADNSGKPVPSHFKQLVTWRLEGDGRPPVSEWAQRVTLNFAADNEASSCRLETEGALAGPPEDCTGEAAEFSALAMLMGSRSPKLMIEMRFVPRMLTTADIAPTPERTFVSRYMLRLKIDEEGQVTDCKTVQIYGVAIPREVLCALSYDRFEAPKSRSGTPMSLVATFLVTASDELPAKP